MDQPGQSNVLNSTGLEIRAKPVGGFQGTDVTNSFKLNQRDWITGICDCCAEPGCMHAC